MTRFLLARAKNEKDGSGPGLSAPLGSNGGELVFWPDSVFLSPSARAREEEENNNSDFRCPASTLCATFLAMTGA